MFRTLIPILLFLTLSATLLAPNLGASGSEESSSPEPEDAIIATWRDGVVTMSEYSRWLLYHGRQDEPGTRSREVASLLLTQEMAAAAQARGADKKLDFVIRSLEDNLLFRAYREKLDATVTTDGAEIDAALREHPDAFHQPYRVRLRNIYKRFPAGATAAQKDALRSSMSQLLSELRAGADFAEVARRESDSENRLRGGMMAVVRAGQLRPEVEAVAMKLAAGELSEVLETNDGLTLLKCQEVLPARTFSEQEQRSRFAANLRTMRTREQWQRQREKLLAEAGPVYDLKAARRPESAAAQAVVRFHDGLVRVSDLELLLARSRGSKKRGEMSADALRRLLEELVVTRTAAKHARVQGLAEMPQFRERVHWRRLEILSADEFGVRVQKRFEPPTDEQLKAYYENHNEDLKRLPHYDLAVLRLTFEAEDPRPAFVRIRRALARIRSGELSFAEAARLHSDHPSSSAGGNIGWLSRRQMAQLGPNPHRAVLATNAGEITDPIRQDQGLWLFHLKGYQEERTLTFEEGRDEITQRMIRESLEEHQMKIREQQLKTLEIRLLPS